MRYCKGVWGGYMTLSKQLPLLFICFFLNTITQAITPTTLDNQMKNFRYRLGIYFKCLPGTNLRTRCTPAEWQAASKTIMRDGALLLITIIGTGIALFGSKKYIYPEIRYQQYLRALDEEMALEKEIKIDREHEIYVEDTAEKYKKAKERTATLFKELFPAKEKNYEKLKAKYEKLYTQWRNAELAVDYSLPQDSPVFKAAAQKAKKYQEQVEKMRPKLRGSFFIQE